MGKMAKKSPPQSSAPRPLSTLLYHYFITVRWCLSDMQRLRWII